MTDECGPGVVSQSNFVCRGPKHKQFITEASRLRSFQDWPISMKQKPNDLAEAGFFYTGKGDQTVCFYCDGGLKDWVVDDVPWEQHALWFDRCAYVQLCKGNEYIKKIKTKVNNVFKDKLNNSIIKNQNSSSKTLSLVPLNDSELCTICLIEKRNAVYIPCGHVVTCVKCALNVCHCPVCREDIERAIRVYL